MPTFDTPEPITATIDLAVGDVRISANDRDTTIVDVQPTDASSADDREGAERTVVEYANGKLLVKGPKPRSWRTKSAGASIDVTIGLPTGSHVHSTVGLGEVHGDGQLGDCRIRTGLGRIQLEGADTLYLKSGAGDISVDRATGRAEVTSGSGDVRLGELERAAVIKNSNGDTWVGVAGGDLRLNTANGSIAVDRAQTSVGAKSANGDVRIGEVVRGSVVLETKIGDLEVGIPEGTVAWLDVNSRFGRVHNALETTEAPESSADTVDVRARTSVGEVVIRRP